MLYSICDVYKGPRAMLNLVWIRCSARTPYIVILLKQLSHPCPRHSVMWFVGLFSRNYGQQAFLGLLLFFAILYHLCLVYTHLYLISCLTYRRFNSDSISHHILIDRTYIMVAYLFKSKWGPSWKGTGQWLLIRTTIVL